MVTPSETWNYGYDYENRLVSVTDNAGYTAAYTYSADGLRLRVQESNHTYPDRWLQYDGVRPVLEGTLDGDTFTTIAKYVWEGDSYYDPLVFGYVGGEWRYYAYDGLGSTRQLLDANQTVTDSYSYEAFGNLLSDGGEAPNPYTYVGSLGYYQTGAPSLLHLGARYYMPHVGRFGSPDPVTPTGGVGETYTYSRQNPANAVDPAGLWCVRLWTKKGPKSWVGTGPLEWWGWQWVMDGKPRPAGGGRYVCYWMKCFVTRQWGYYRWKVTQWTLCCEGICCELKKDYWYERTEEQERVDYASCRRGYTTRGWLVQGRYVICEPPSGSPD